MPVPPDAGSTPSRRAFLAAGAVALAAAACGDAGSATHAKGTTTGVTTAPSLATTSGPPGTTAPPGPSRFVVDGPSTPSRVALTFHVDGDLGLAAQILDTLANRKVVMTAFIVGEWLDANPTWGKRIQDGGHELANHTYTHPTFESLAPAAMASEITRCRDTLARLTGNGGSLFRPSGTANGTTTPSAAVLTAAGQAGYPVTLGFGVDPLDYQSPGASVVTQRTLAAVRPGSVISLHFGYPGTLAALPGILDGLEQRNLTPVTATRLIA